MGLKLESLAIGLALGGAATLCHGGVEPPPYCEQQVQVSTISGLEEARGDMVFRCLGEIVLVKDHLSFVSYSPNRRYLLAHQAAADDDLRHVLYTVDEAGLPVDGGRVVGDRYLHNPAWVQQAGGKITGLYFMSPFILETGQTLGSSIRYYHLVQGGETLASIADLYFFRLPVGNLLQANYLADPDRLQAGSLLRMDPVVRAYTKP